LLRCSFRASILNFFSISLLVAFFEQGETSMACLRIECTVPSDMLMPWSSLSISKKWVKLAVQ